jgi:hypothetical protein
MKKLSASFNLKRFLLVAIAIDALLFLAACDASWVSEAQSILTLLGPAISAVLEILSAFGMGLSPAVAADFTSWEQQAQVGLSQVGTLISQYNAAEASAKPGILSEIQTLIQTISNNLNTILPTLHVEDAGTQAKITAVFTAILAELQGLAALIPAVQVASAMEDQTAALEYMAGAAKKAGLKSAKQFADDFNRKAGAFGKQFRIKGPGAVSDIKHTGE